MKLLVVNPNSTASMTAKIGAMARAVASVGTEIVATNPAAGPESIEGYFDEAFSVPGMLNEIRRHPGMCGYIVACFDDTGLDAARCIADAPVIGIGEAAFHMAALLAHRFGVVTTLPRSIPAIENNLLRYGLASRCAKVRAADVPVLELEHAQDQALKRISAEITRLLDEDGAEAIVLGCAGMADIATTLSCRFGVPVLDGVACAVKLAEGTAAMGLKTSRVRAYASPIAKPYQSCELSAHR
ncbi:aspartate/glutamate racemase family protein [Aminobacter sp. SR38]|uniref:aspartate/glutamate racemase family protein n=1 Tax=Aminobacter sp. SR38 TaxID=2774562 RepID=UPI001784B667|nr:aspartate/glutamate racemase family protein [Aminobacter sp. SR38]QOF72740.1 aspartate/glutamate racemase family protein [Aminobacter sp. SR38]